MTTTQSCSNNFTPSSQRAFDDVQLIHKGLRLMGVLGTVGLVLTISGGTQETATDPSKGSSLRHIGVILYGVLYGLIVLVHLYFWSNKSQIMAHRRSVCQVFSILVIQ